jgi:MFS family permease
MNVNRFFRELAWPITDLVVLVAIVISTLLAALVQAAGQLVLWLNLLLGLLLLPALFRYLLMLLEARAYGRPTPVATIELFSFVDNFWSLAPLVIFALLIWGGILLDENVSALAARVFVAAMLAVAPASLAVLAITRSPEQAFTPRAILRMIAVCEWHYLLVPATVVLAFLVTSLLTSVGAPDLLVLASRFYCLFLLFTFTGGLLHAKGARFALSFDGDDDADLPPEIDDLTRSRQRVVNHAYGFFSRGNRAGAMAHVQSAIENEGDIDDACHWYFTEMLNWESKDGALLLAQSTLTRLLDEQRDVEAVKLISRCLLEDHDFRPLPGDLDRALDAAVRLDRDDLEKLLAE